MSLSGKEAAELARAESDKIRKKLEGIVEKKLNEKKWYPITYLKRIRVEVFAEIRDIIAEHYNIKLTEPTETPDYFNVRELTKTYSDHAPTYRSASRYKYVDVSIFLSVFPEELNQNKELISALKDLDKAIQTVEDKLDGMREREVSSFKNKMHFVDIVRKAMYAIGIALGITSVICILAIASPVSAIAATLGVTAGAITVGGVSVGLGTAAGATAVAGTAIAAIAGNFLGKNLRRRLYEQIDAEIDLNVVKSFIDIAFEKYQLCHNLSERLKSQSAELGGESKDHAASSGVKVKMDKGVVDNALAMSTEDKGVERK